MGLLANHVCSVCGVCLAITSLAACEGAGGVQKAGYEDGGQVSPDSGECENCGGKEPLPESSVPDAQEGLADADAGRSRPGPTDASADPVVSDPALRMHPGDLLDLTNWKLTVPLETEHEGNPDEYKNPELASLTLEPHFMLTPARDAVVFRAHAGGATTVTSSYPRSELREMTLEGSELASWSTTSGVHRMKVRQAITSLPQLKPHVVSAQIHDANDDVVMVRLQETHLYVEGGSERLGTLDLNYQLGTVFTLEIIAADGIVDVYYNGELKVSVRRATAGCYFKVGCYTQSNVARGEAPEAYGEVVVYELSVTHEP